MTNIRDIIEFNERQAASDIICKLYQMGDFAVGDRLDALYMRSRDGDRDAHKELCRLTQEYDRAIYGDD